MLIPFRFLRPRRNFVPPSSRQCSHAKSLGVAVTKKMSRGDVSAAIAHAERCQQFGVDLVAEENRWLAFAEGEGTILAVYLKGRTKIVDVLRVYGASIQGRGKHTLSLSVEIPRIHKDRHIGEYVDFDATFELPLTKLLHHEPVTIDLDVEKYRKAVERGLKIAKRIRTP